jgi:LysR family transcriptional regulator, transcriptional activator for dmlA
VAVTGWFLLQDDCACRCNSHLSLTPPGLTEDAFDVCVRFGELPDARVIPRKLANRRLLCAWPGYLRRHGPPRSPADRARHNCISIHHGDDAYGLWRLSSGRRSEAVRVTGSLSTNDGDIPPEPWTATGTCCVPNGTLPSSCAVDACAKCWRTTPLPPTDIYAVYPQRHQKSRRVTAFVDTLCTSLNSAARKIAGAP